MEERLQKALARAGVASRRKSEQLIQEGRVSVNGAIVTELGTTIDPERDEVRLDGERVRLAGGPLRYIMLNKPRHVISTTDDELGRSNVLHLVPGAADERLFPVGRLDSESEGLILLTNDGELANRLTHPRYEHEKEYRVKVFGRVTEEEAERLRQGIYLEEGKTQPAQVTIESADDETSWLRVILREGKKRQLRRMFQIIGHPVRRLIRVRMGPVELGELGNGQWRPLTEVEVEALRSDRRRPLSEEKKKSERPTRKAGWATPKKSTKRPHGKQRRNSSRGRRKKEGRGGKEGAER